MEYMERAIIWSAMILTVLSFIINQGCNNKKNGNSQPDLLHAINTGNLKEIQEIFERPDFSLENYPEKGRLLRTAFERYGEMRRGESFNNAERKAYREKTVKIVELLLAEDVDVNTLSDGISPLYYPIWHGYDGLAELMIDRGADVNAFSRRIDRPLIYSVAIKPNSLWVLRLVEEGADINIKNSDGNTPLHLAVIERKSSDIIKMLLENGADPTIKNNEGETPIMIDEKRDQNNHKVQARLQLMRSYITLREN